MGLWANLGSVPLLGLLRPITVHSIAYNNMKSTRQWWRGENLEIITNAVDLACARLSDSIRGGNVLKAKLRRARLGKGGGGGGKNVSLQPPRVFRISYYWTTFHHYLGAWNRLRSTGLIQIRLNYTCCTSKYLLMIGPVDVTSWIHSKYITRRKTFDYTVYCICLIPMTLAFY